MDLSFLLKKPDESYIMVFHAECRFPGYSFINWEEILSVELHKLITNFILKELWVKTLNLSSAVEGSRYFNGRWDLTPEYFFLQAMAFILICTQKCSHSKCSHSTISSGYCTETNGRRVKVEKRNNLLTDKRNWIWQENGLYADMSDLGQREVNSHLM